MPTGSSDSRQRDIPRRRSVCPRRRVSVIGSVVLVDINLRRTRPRTSASRLGQGIQTEIPRGRGEEEVYRLAGCIVFPATVEHAERSFPVVYAQGDAPSADVAVAIAVLPGEVGHAAGVVDLAHVDGDAVGEGGVGGGVPGVPEGVVVAVDGFVAVVAVGAGEFEAVDVAVPLRAELVDTAADALAGAEVGG